MPDRQPIVVTTDVTYRRARSYSGRSMELTLDIYRGAGTTDGCPVIMWLFDGAFVAGDKRHMAYYARDAARRGWVGVAVQYRTRPVDLARMTLDHFDGAADDAYDDALAAVHWLSDNAERYGLDRSRIVAGGISAGAITALHLVYAGGITPSPLAGGIAIAGDSLVAPPPGRPPVIMFHGLRDKVIPFRRAERTHACAVAAGNVNVLVPLDDGHGIGWRRSQEIRETGAQFLEEHVLRSAGG